MNRSLITRHLPLAACLAAAAIAFAPSLPATSIPIARVYLGDLDLKTSAGQRVAQRRIADAIETVCIVKGSVVPPTVRARMQVRACREQALAGVQSQFEQHGLPRLPARTRG